MKNLILFSDQQFKCIFVCLDDLIFKVVLHSGELHDFDIRNKRLGMFPLLESS